MSASEAPAIEPRPITEVSGEVLDDKSVKLAAVTTQTKEERRRIQSTFLGEPEWEMAIDEPVQELEIMSLKGLVGRKAEYKGDQIPNNTVKLEVMSTKAQEISIGLTTVEKYEGESLRGYININTKTGAARIHDGNMGLNNYLRHRFGMGRGGEQKFADELIDALMKDEKVDGSDI